MNKKEYHSEYYKLHRDEAIARSKAHYEKNKEAKKAYDKEYRKKNREKLNANGAAYRLLHLDKLHDQEAVRRANRSLDTIARIVLWRIKNADKMKAYEAQRRKEPERILATKKASKAWKDAHPEERRNHVRNRRAKLRAGGTLSKDIEQKLMVLQKGLCPVCKANLKDGFHLDHVIAVASGGKNEDSNAQLLCPKCNQSKGDKHPIEFMQSRGFLL